MHNLNGVTVKVINPTQQITEKFAKREFVVTDSSSQYPQDIILQVTQDKCNLLDGIQLNDKLNLFFNIRGREWTSPQGEVKYFNTLEVWKMEKVEGGSNNGPSDDFGVATEKTDATDFTASSEEDDLPF